MHRDIEFDYFQVHGIDTMLMSMILVEGMRNTSLHDHNLHTTLHHTTPHEISIIIAVLLQSLEVS